MQNSEMARLDGETSNQLFEVLSDWNAQLEHLRFNEPPVPPCPCIRLSDAQRARLTAEAAGRPLGAYIKAKALGDKPLRRPRHEGITVADRRPLAQALALLGRSRIASNLNQIAHAVNVGVLPVTPETEAELFAAVRDVRAVRRMLVAALGMKAESDQ